MPMKSTLQMEAQLLTVFGEPLMPYLVCKSCIIQIYSVVSFLFCFQYPYNDCTYLWVKSYFFKHCAHYEVFKLDILHLKYLLLLWYNDIILSLSIWTYDGMVLSMKVSFHCVIEHWTNFFYLTSILYPLIKLSIFALPSPS